MKGSIVPSDRGPIIENENWYYWANHASLMHFYETAIILWKKPYLRWLLPEKEELEPLIGLS